MKPVAFDYCRPESVAEATGLLAEHGEEAIVLSGGLSLGPMLNMRLVRPTIVVDVNRIAELGGVRRANGEITTGALLRQAEAMNDPELMAELPLLAAALPHVGHYQTRSRGTFGGSVAHADPSAEIPLALVTLGGSVELASRRRTRSVPAREFFQGLLTTARRPEEMITGLRWPRRQARTGYAFDEIAQRHGDFAIAAAACMLELDAGGAVARIELGLGGVEDRPLAVSLDGVEGRAPDAALAAEVAEQVRARVVPIEDAGASAAYRLDLAALLSERVVARAAEDAEEG